METVKNQDIYSLKKIYIVEKRTRESIHEIWFEIDVCIFLSQFRMYLDVKNPKEIVREIYACTSYQVTHSLDV